MTKERLLAKRQLEAIYGKGNTVNIDMGNGKVLLVIGCGELIKIVEVKEIKKNTYYPAKKERKQFQRIICFAKLHKIPAELWAYKFYGKGKPIIKHTDILWSDW